MMDLSNYSPGTPVAEEDSHMTPEAIDGLPLDGDPSLPPGLVASPSEQSPGLVTELPGFAATPQPPPGINSQLPAVPFDDFDELMQDAVLTSDQPQPSEGRGRLPTVSEIEPDQEEVPPTVPPTPGPNTPREPQVSQLQEAI